MTLPKELSAPTRVAKILAAIVFITLPFVGFFLGIRYQEIADQTKNIQNSEISISPTTSVQTADTSTWKTYSFSPFSSYTFSFQYPPDYTIETKTNSNELNKPYFDDKSEGLYEKYSVVCGSENKGCIGYGGGYFSVEVYENRQKWSLEEWMKLSQYAPQTNCQKKDSRATITKQSFLNTEAFVFIAPSPGGPRVGCADIVEGVDYQTGDTQEIILKKDQNIIALYEFYNIPYLKSELDQILSTFKFTE